MLMRSPWLCCSPTHGHPPTPGSPSPTYHVLEQPGSRVRIFGQVAFALCGEDNGISARGQTPPYHHPACTPPTPAPWVLFESRWLQKMRPCHGDIQEDEEGAHGVLVPFTSRARSGARSSHARSAWAISVWAKVVSVPNSSCTAATSCRQCPHTSSVSCGTTWAGTHRYPPQNITEHPPMPAFAELGFKCQSQSGTAFCSPPSILQYPSPKLVTPLIDAISAVQ